MKTENDTYQVDAQQYEQALTILEKEQLNLKPTRVQGCVFKIFKFTVYGVGLIGGILLLLVLSIYAMELLPEPIKYQDAQNNLVGIVVVSLYLFYALLAPTSLIIVALFFLNIPLLFKLWRRSKLVRQLGLDEVSKEPWKAERKKWRFTDILTILTGVMGLVIMVGTFFVMEHWLLVWENLFYVFALAACVALISFYFMRRTQARLEIVDRLLSSLKENKARLASLQDTYLNIPAKAYEQIAQIERTQISRERVQSILTGLEESESRSYFVQKSREASTAQAQLDPVMRLRVQKQIDQLTSVPHPAEAFKDPETGVRQLHVPESPVILDFKVDDDARRIKVLAIRPAPDDVRPTAQGKE